MTVEERGKQRFCTNGETFQQSYPQRERSFPDRSKPEDKMKRKAVFAVFLVIVIFLMLFLLTYLILHAGVLLRRDFTVRVNRDREEQVTGEKIESC